MNTPSKLRIRGLLATAIALALSLGTAHAQNHRHHEASLERDPFAPVFLVTSRAIHRDGLQELVRDGVARRDAVGTDLVLAEVKAHQLAQISHIVHERRKQCGGYFAFPTREQAEAFIASGQADAAMRASLIAYTIDNQATVNPWLPQVTASNIHSTITHLSTQYRNRYYATTTGKSSAEWIRNHWQSLAGSRTDVTSELFTACSDCSTQPSVILTVQGAELPNEVVVMGGHLDSISNSGSGESMTAPGADDDASGIASITEVIRVALASGWRPKRTVKFMGYAAEEVGLRGSRAIANSFRNAGVNVVGVMQLDMTNYRASGATSHMRITTDYTNADINTFMGQVFDTYLAPLGLTRGTTSCGYACSDHASWTNAGYPAGFMFEATTFGQIHTSGDTLANMGNQTTNAANISKFALAFLGELAKTAGTGGNAPPVANFTSTVSGLTANFTDSSTDSDGTIVSRSWNFGDGTTSTATNPSKTYSAAGTYSVSLTVTDDDGTTNTKTSSVTVGSTGNVLQKGVPVNNLSAAVGTSLNYTMVVPAGSQNLTFTTSGGTGDADLYVRFGSAPTDSVYDCRPYKSGNAETCTFATPQAGTYHVRLKAYSAFSGVSLVGDYAQCADCGPGPIPYTNNTDYTINDNATVESPITVSGRTGNAPSNATVAVNIVHTYIGDLKVDLVAPDGTLYNVHNRSGGSADNINKTVTLNLSSEPLNGTWKLRVNDNAANDVGYLNSWTVTF